MNAQGQWPLSAAPIEASASHHGVSANASETEPARLLAVFVVDSDETNLTMDDKE